MSYNRGFYSIKHSDLDDRLRRLRGGRFGRPGFAFECVMANLFQAKGYWVTKGYNVDDWEGLPYGDRQTSDMGIDLSVERAGRKTVVQCKHYVEGTPVGGEDVNKLLGSVSHTGAKAGVFVTTSAFTKQCYEIQRSSLATDVNLELWDWPKVKDEMRTHLLGA